MAGLVVLGVDLEGVQEAPAVFGDAAEVGRGQGSGVKPVQDHPDRLLIWCTVPAADRIPWSSQAGQVRLAGSSGPLPDRGEPIIPGGGKSADRDRDQAGQRVNPPLW